MTRQVESAREASDFHPNGRVTIHQNYELHQLARFIRPQFAYGHVRNSGVRQEFRQVMAGSVGVTDSSSTDHRISFVVTSRETQGLFVFWT